MKPYEEELKAIEAKLDARDRLYELLDRLHRQGKQIPPEYLAAWNKHMEDKRSWREQISRVKLIKCAKMMHRNRFRSKEEKQKMAMKFLEKVTRRKK